eukprot:3020517-Rhodomonas_salina.1
MGRAQPATAGAAAGARRVIAGGIGGAGAEVRSESPGTEATADQPSATAAGPPAEEVESAVEAADAGWMHSGGKGAQNEGKMRGVAGLCLPIGEEAKRGGRSRQLASWKWLMGGKRVLV